MKLSAVKQALGKVEGINFRLPNGAYVPEHFHVTEVGLITKKFIDCGGTTREEIVVNFQLWNADDYEHRLKAGKLHHIISLSEEVLGIGDYEVEVEYQDTTIGKYDLDFDGIDFVLVSKQTACLAPDQCGIETSAITSADAVKATATSCKPGSGCC